MMNNKIGLVPRQRNQFTSLSHEFSDEEMVRDWTLTEADKLDVVKSGGQHSPFQLLKEYPPSASIYSIQSYLQRYQLLAEVDIDSIKIQLEPSFVNYLYKLTMRYNARDLKQFNEPKRYSMMVCFLLEIRKILLDYLVKMHDQFIQEMLRESKLVRQLDTGKLKHLPDSTPTFFIPKELIRSSKTKEGKLNRNAWELGLAIIMKDVLRSGDLYLPKSKQHVSFWELVLNKHTWQDIRETAYQDLQQPYADKVKTTIIEHFNQTIAEAKKQFSSDNFAEIKNGNLKLRKDDKA